METSTKRLETEVKLQRAFIKVMTRVGFERLTVQLLTREAQINRGTFYLHYVDKFDLLAHYENEIVAQIRTIFSQYPKPVLGIMAEPMPNAFERLFAYLYRQRTLVAILFQSPASQLDQQVKQLIMEVLGPVTGQPDREVPTDFAQELVAQGVLDYVVYWLGQPAILSPAEAYALFTRTRQLSPQQLMHGTAND
ncbi:TetR/AcrR family transcriptional regulator [Levilactobacillus fuyuanensis]|jgi:AcrR family transcriptional regulator|uniref:TetR/AcrR family transcriptional regulator n=1 Tax=Levilactobacillus fuyuanensis TaxID=2486022 RepID=A0ABW4H2Y4_9LACO|nr:TetR/AcrR family transcriptional regulator [Levilactobacillus fuyuanensis]